MSISYRGYQNTERFGADYHRVVDFLTRINEKAVVKPNFLWGRWVWMISRPVDDEEKRAFIGIWSYSDKIVALVTFELSFGVVHISTDREYKHLIPEIITYAEEHLSVRDSLEILIPDDDRDFQRLALKQGYLPTEEKEPVSVIDFQNNLDYTLPEGFKIVCMSDRWDFFKYNRVMWRGFGHAGEPSQEREDIEWRKTMLSSPHLNPDLVVAVVSPNGNYASHCGLWHLPGQIYSYIEPLVTDPDYRNLGLGKAALFEALKRTEAMGAKEAYVCSDQQFYYNLGFYPLTTETVWKKKLRTAKLDSN